MADISVIIPAFNEQKAIESTLRSLREALGRDPENTYQVIAVNDGSTDETLKVLKGIEEGLDLEVLHSPLNHGYGAAIKRGLARSSGEIVVTFDADGQHDPQYIPTMVGTLKDYDVCIGVRPPGQGSPLWRRPGKMVLGWLVNFLCQSLVPDFNCGYRAFRREVLESIQHLCADGFSFSTTCTISLYGINANVYYLPVQVRPRTGRSTVTPMTGLQTIILILTAITTFKPLRVFLPVSLFIGLFGLVFLVYGLATRNISDITVLFLLTSLHLFLIGLLAEQIAQLRKKQR
jgi:glycosyltransferase involved in cell wall biosynthesis